MKNLKNLLPLLMFVILFNCDKDDEPIAQSTQEILLKSKLKFNLENDSTKTFLDYPFLVGVDNISTANNLIGCVFNTPYISTVEVVNVKLLSTNLEGVLIYNGVQYSIGESFVSQEYNLCIQDFNQSSLFYVGMVPGNHEIEIEVLTNSMTKLIYSETILFE